MFDPLWLSQMPEDELEELYTHCHFRAKNLRREGRFGLARWWDLMSVQCCDAIGKLYADREEPSAQLSLVDMPSRVPPEERPSA